MGELITGLLGASVPLVMVLDRAGRILLWNQACSELTGFTFDEVRGREAWALVAEPDEAERVRSAHLELLKGQPRLHEWWLRTRSGARRCVDWSYELTWRADREVQFVTAIGMDRTEAREAEDRLRVSEAKFAGIVSIASDAIVSMDDEHRIVIYNEGARQVFGWEPDEVIGRPIEVLIPERFRAGHHEQVARFAGEAVRSRPFGGGGREVTGLCKDGREFAASGTISKLDVAGTRLYTAVLRDVTAQKRAARDQQFLAEAGTLLATTLDYDETLAKIAELSIRFLAECCVLDVADEQGALRRWRVLHRDPAMARASRAIEQLELDRARPHLGQRALQTRRTQLVTDIGPEDLERLAQSPAHLALLRELGPHSYVALPLLVHGRIVGIMVLVRGRGAPAHTAEDARLAEDLARLAAYAIESARLYRAARRAVHARDQVLGFVAHDLRNPISAARLSAQSLRSVTPDDRERVLKRAATIERSLDRASRLIDDLLDVSRIESVGVALERAPVAPAALLADAVDTFRTLVAEARLDLRVEVDGELPPVLGDRDRILQVLANLVGNATKFTPAGGSVRIRVYRRGGEICFEVADTGPGIRPEDVPHLFDRFWQARRRDRRGAGLGLPIAKAIVEAHGGSIWVSSTPGAGSSFYFTLPLSSENRNTPV